MVQNPGSKERDFPLVANRDFIVQACNAHDLLVEALERINTMLDGPRAGEAFTSGQIVAIIESALSLVKGARK